MTLTNEIIRNHLRRPRSIKKITKEPCAWVNQIYSGHLSREKVSELASSAWWFITGILLSVFVSVLMIWLLVALVSWHPLLPLLAAVMIIILICIYAAETQGPLKRKLAKSGVWQVISAKVISKSVDEEVIIGRKPQRYILLRPCLYLDHKNERICVTNQFFSSIQTQSKVWLVVNKQNPGQVYALYTQSVFDSYDDGTKNNIIENNVINMDSFYRDGVIKDYR